MELPGKGSFSALFRKTMKYALTFPPLLFLLISAPALAAEPSAQPAPAAIVPAGEGTAPPQEPCQIEDRACVLKQIEDIAPAIDNKNWHDQTLRELAKTYAFEGDTDKAISLIPEIKTPDTQAMTIRGIGMAAAGNKLTKEQYESLFTKLRAVADSTIKHPPSYAIALTYIAMAQAFAKDNEGAWKTAGSMENAALRHKAFAETAEIQAENGDFEASMHSIGLIESEAFRNKAYNVVSKIFAEKKLYQEALNAAAKITNAYKRAEALQFTLDRQKPREAKKSGREETQE